MAHAGAMRIRSGWESGLHSLYVQDSGLPTGAMDLGCPLFLPWAPCQLGPYGVTRSADGAPSPNAWVSIILRHCRLGVEAQWDYTCIERAPWATPGFSKSDLVVGLSVSWVGAPGSCDTHGFPVLGCAWLRVACVGKWHGRA